MTASVSVAARYSYCVRRTFMIDSIFYVEMPVEPIDGL
jgi:hypothetical protein